jgi:hypothetical protein
VKKITLCAELWKSLLETADSWEIDPECAACLYAWIETGVDRMEAERRLGAEDLAIAQANLRNFMRLIKIETGFLNQSARISLDALHRAEQRLQAQSGLDSFVLWPFWPDPIAEEGKW